MEAFLTLLFKIIPLYLIILLGFISDRFLNVKKESISALLIYIISPIIVFQGVVSRDFTASILIIPFIFLTISFVLALSFYFIFKKTWTDSTKSVLGFAVASGNTGYFGLPIIMMLFGQEAMQVAVMGIFTSQLFEMTLGFYLMARGESSSKNSLKKLLKLPTIYAFTLALILNTLGYRAQGTILDFFVLFKGAYSVLGMMLIGLALSNIHKQTFDLKFISLGLLGKLVLWPLLMTSFILLDYHYFHLYDLLTYKVMILISVTPVAANTVAYATQFNIRPDKAATIVVLSTLMALFYLPIVVGIISQF